MRDSFPAAVKGALAKRAGYECSICRRGTAGPTADPEGTQSIGVAAHITAAAPGGPRYDLSMSQSQRRSSTNGIWVCALCALWIDLDPRAFTVDLLRERRRLAEERARSRMQLSKGPSEDDGSLWNHAGAPTGIDNMPLANRHFVGRVELLERLSSELTRGRRVSVEALVGLGGIGKSQLAVRYAHDNADAYAIRWFVRAEGESTLVDDLARLGRRLGVVSDTTPSVDSARATLDYLASTQLPWLLVLDNASSPDQVRRYLPHGSGHVIITSRTHDWSAFAVPVDVDVLPRQDSIRLLRGEDPTAADADADVVAQTLGDLPLALEQARAYMERTGIDVATLRSLLRTRLDKLLRERPRTEYPMSVATTWDLSIGEAARIPLAKEVLCVCSYCAPEQIPRALIRAVVLRWAPDGLAGNDSAVDEAVGALRTLSLVSTTPAEVSLHRLVQAVTRSSGLCAPHEVLAALIEALNSSMVFDEFDLTTWADAQRLVPHVVAICEVAVPMRVEPEVSSGLLSRAAQYLSLQAEFEPAQTAYEAALAIQEELWGTDSLRLLPVLNLLGDLLGTKGDYRTSRAVLERCRALIEPAMERGAIAANDPEATMNLNLLGELTFEEGDHDKAGEMLREVLARRLSNRATQAVQIATSLNNVGKVCERAGLLDDASRMYHASLAIRRRELAPDHPHLATSLSNLGLLAQKRGVIKEAIAYQRAALEARTRWLGNRHPHVVNSRQWLRELETERA
jgi:hypothetical protein